MATVTTNPTLQKQVEALNRRDVPSFTECYAKDAQVFDPAYPERLRGRDAIAKDMNEFIEAFPDLEATVSDVIEQGETIAYEITMRGTHRGPLVAPIGHIPATGKKVEVAGGIFARLDDEGRIADERRYYDLTGLLYQLGQLQ